MTITITATSIILHDNTGSVEDNTVSNSFFRNVTSFSLEGSFLDFETSNSSNYFTNTLNFTLGQTPVFNVNSKNTDKVVLLSGCNPTINLKTTNTCGNDAYFLAIHEVNPLISNPNGTFFQIGTEIGRALTNTEISDINSSTGLNLTSNTFTYLSNSITITPGHTYRIKLVYTGLGQWKEVSKYVQYKSGSVDLVIADYAGDIGFEPSGDPWGIKDIYHSPSVINKLYSNSNTALTANEFDAPDYINVTGNSNRLAIKVTNNGCASSDPNGLGLYKLRLFWTRARTNELWDRHWNYDLTNNGGVSPIPPGNIVPWGSEITISDPNDFSSPSAPFVLPSISAGDTYNWQPVNGVDWYPPNPDDFDASSGQLSNNRPVICLLARINETTSTNDPILFEPSPTATPIDQYVKNNNNIATRNSILYNNISFINMKEDGSEFNYGQVSINVEPGLVLNDAGDVIPVNRTRNICIDVVRNYDENNNLIGYSNNFSEFGEVRLIVTNGIWTSWLNGGSSASGISTLTEEDGIGIFKLTEESGCLNNVEMKFDWQNELAGLQFNFITPNLPTVATQLTYRISVLPTDLINDFNYVSTNAIIDVDIPNIENAPVSLLSGIKKITSKNIGLNIYPSPADNIVSIKSDLIENDFNSIVVTDLLGRAVFSYFPENTITNFDIDTKNWNNGVYFITVSSLNQVKTSKIIVQH